ncbi:MAG: cyclase family protein, partial [Thermoplasmata archaeon]
MRRIDISMPLREAMAAFPGDPVFEAHRVKAIEAGDRYNVSQISLGTHAGTHVDPPLHFVPGGGGVDRVDLAVLNGPCRVVRVPETASSVSAKQIAALPRGTQRLLLRTRNSTRWATDFRFFPDYAALEPEAAKLLVERGVRL